MDEAGRGPLAGPVVAASVCFLCEPEEWLVRLIDDSKRLAAAARERAFSALVAARRTGVVAFAIAAASVPEIARLNILRATLLAMRRAVARLPFRPDLALIDGTVAPDFPCPVRCLPRGDATSLSIAAASILAKVTRDRVMARLALRYPGYAWDRNQGYPTAEHRAALARLGATAHHRRGFAPVEWALSRH